MTCYVCITTKPSYNETDETTRIKNIIVEIIPANIRTLKLKNEGKANKPPFNFSLFDFRR